MASDPDPNLTTPAISEPNMSSILATPHVVHSPSSSLASDDEPSTTAVATAIPTTSRLPRPGLGARKSSGSMIVSRDLANTVVEPEFDEHDVRTMSPRRNSEEVDKLGEEARKDLIEQAKILQTSLQDIVDRVETVKSEHEKLEGGNKFLQSYAHSFSACVFCSKSLCDVSIIRLTHSLQIYR